MGSPAQRILKSNFGRTILPSASEKTERREPVEATVKSTALDLVYESLDLRYTVEDLSGGAEQLKGKNEGETGSISALKSEIVDLDFNLVAYGTAVADGVHLTCRVVHVKPAQEFRLSAEPTNCCVSGRCSYPGD